MSKGLGRAIKEVLEKAPKSERLLSDLWSNEKGMVWRLGKDMA
jgi:hypothetical protein